ncbi:uncharacterized protein METZ01_LOCUS50550 [marine metagenome]|uniref:Uncharacterized protein n=1 Tax=marine metagenome TaxID=408172 RepID=A0A381S0R4_9ZZZZ
MHLLNGQTRGYEGRAHLASRGLECLSHRLLVLQEGRSDGGREGQVHPGLKVVQRLQPLAEHYPVQQAARAGVQDNEGVWRGYVRVE